MFGKIQVPRRIDGKLRDSKWVNALGKTFETFAWMPSRALELFPDYTDHGPDHLSSVLAVAEYLVGPGTWQYFSPDDAATLTLAVLLHDLGMHVTCDGFSSLFCGKTSHKPIQYFDSKGWDHLWVDFRTQASRFDSRQNIALFGSPEPVVPPELGQANWTENQRRLAGECLRRHHARLAHEIAFNGFPGPPSAAPLRLDDGLDSITDLAGVIARSHGMELRICVEYLKANYNDTVQPRNVRAVYLMTLLRLADFLQFGPERASPLRLRAQSLRSPVSRREWKKHIFEVSQHGEDPEAVYVHCEPPDVETYLGVKELLVAFQNEMDSCWAVLGEVYRDSKIGLSKRRVRSNLDAKAWQPARGKYVPLHAKFDTNNPDLLDCLVGPLYNHDPAYGVRELIQNSVDAVREMEALGRYSGSKEGPDVVVKIAADALTIEDVGTGMTSDTVVNYFLRAGASFRRSDVWRRDFANALGNSRVLRSGRFGVGALAAFLIGPRIEVSTRHWSQGRGVRFRATIFDDPIELSPIDRNVGTTVRIPLSQTQYFALVEPFRHARLDQLFGWFKFRWPRVSIAVGPEVVRVQGYIASDCDSKNVGWVPANIEGLGAQWRRFGSGCPMVNGLEIRESGIKWSQQEILDLNTHQSYKCQVSWWDPDGRLQLDLQRTTLSAVEGNETLFASFVKNWIASALAHPGTHFPNVWSPRPAPSPDPWAWTDIGLLLYDLELIRMIKPNTLVVEHGLDPSPQWPHRSDPNSRWGRKFLPTPSVFLTKAASTGFSDSVEFYPPHPLPPQERTWMTETWLDIIGPQCIPYDLKERKSHCAKAYQILSDEVDFWEREYRTDRKARKRGSAGSDVF